MIVEDLREKMKCCDNEEPLSFYLVRPDGSEEELLLRNVGSSAGGRMSFIAFTPKPGAKTWPAKQPPKPRVVTCKNYTGWNFSIAQLWGSGPLFTVICGYCDATFKKRIPMISRPRLECPHCKTLNIIPIEVEV